MNEAKLGVMIDIETFGLSPNAVVWQIAALPFDLQDPDPDMYLGWREYLPVNPQVEAGNTIEASTLEWWMNQEKEARVLMTGNLTGDLQKLQRTIETLVFQLIQIRNLSAGFELWAKGPQFDVVIIERLFTMCRLDIPYKYGEVRDLRTLINVSELENKGLNVPKPKDYVAHSALSDCVYQVLQYKAAMDNL